VKISKLDHLVITTANPEILIQFYTRVLDLELETFADGQKALKFGKQKINLHEAGAEIRPHAKHPTPGAADLCFITQTPIAQVLNHLASCNIEVIAGPVTRSGASGTLLSIYIMDPDGNLIELANLADD